MKTISWVIFYCCFSFFSIVTAGEFTYTGDGAENNELCEEVVQSEEHFKNFRQSHFCTRVVDACWPSLGSDFLGVICAKYPQLLDHLDEFRKNDSVGNTSPVLYGEFGYFCPTTLRYILIAGHLQSLFGSLDGKTIVEIGGGYGGQCRILSSLFSFKEYTIVDLPAVLALAKKYLKAFNINNVRFITPDQVPSELPCDLLISNYAFSERSPPSKIKYINRILNHSKCGYMICNDNLGSGKEEVFKTHFENDQVTVQFLPEIPSTSGGNYLIVWN